jgi:hypothetical protein
VSDRRVLLEALDQTVAAFVEVCGGAPDPAMMVNREWTVKDVAAHVTFWHESFARNLSDVVAGVPARPLRGTYAELNSRCMLEMRPLPLDEILGRLLSAHGTIGERILDPSLHAIPYRRGSRDYGPDEHLEVVTAHIRSHADRILTAERGSSLHR